MKLISVVMPVYNVEKYVAEAIESVLVQTYPHFELIIVNDGSTDQSNNICHKYKDPRIRIISQKNRGLAGARNTGIRESSGELIAFLDSTDRWAPNKLLYHAQHLNNNPKVGVSYCLSELIDENSKILGLAQVPKLKNISFKNIICRNPIGNGSAPVIRRSVIDSVSYCKYHGGIKDRCYFDESLKQSEDIEYWLRIAVLSESRFEGINKSLTYYRVNDSGLSANTDKQLQSWESAISKISLFAPRRVGLFLTLAKAYQLRYLARRAIIGNNASAAIRLCCRSMVTNCKIILEEPGKTFLTLFSAFLLSILPYRIFMGFEKLYCVISSILKKQPRQTVSKKSP